MQVKLKKKLKKSNKLIYKSLEFLRVNFFLFYVGDWMANRVSLVSAAQILS